ncbi:MAG: hypothetical protein RDU14_07070 [Melioribacteraceae bacterium]|nr:hypothetical protein [Melioribacteraceae bacterium]
MIKNIENNSIKSLTPQQKLDEALKLYFLARELKRAGIKLLHPDIGRDELEKKTTEVFLNAKS